MGVYSRIVFNHVVHEKRGLQCINNVCTEQRKQNQLNLTTFWQCFEASQTSIHASMAYESHNSVKSQ